MISAVVAPIQEIITSVGISRCSHMRRAVYATTEGVACDQLPLDALERGLSEFGPKVVLRLHPLDHALGLGRLGSPFPLLARAFDPDLV